MDLETLEVKTNVLLSTPQALRLPMRWIAILHGRIKANLAATSGIHSAHDVIKMLMVGAKVTGLCSILLARGIDYVRHFERGVVEWMEEHEYESVDQLRGCMSQMKCPNPATFERAQYMRAITSFEPPSYGGAH
jgi:dihydroorotate dehydrogenase (fumarate)